MTPTTPTRIFDDVFTPSPTNNVLCIYTLEFSCPATAGPTGTSIIIELRSNTGAPVTARTSGRLNVIGTSGDTVRVRQVLTYLVPAGDSVELVTVQNVGGGAVIIVEQVEEIYSPPP